MLTGRPKSQRYKSGDIVTSKSCGDFEVVEVFHAREILCKSITTGYEKHFQAVHLDSGGMKDPLFPAILSVGYFGIGSNSSKSDPEIYQAWRNMLARCYCEKYQDSHPTYKGTVVCDEWHNFQNFAEWVKENYSNIKGRQLDKDIKGDGNKIYGPATCLFVSPSENSQKAHCKNARIVSPSGEVINIYNIKRFAIENGLNQPHLSSVLSGKRKSHKGYKACTS